MTSVIVPGSRHVGFADYGRRDPAEMIGRLRGLAQDQMEAAQAVLDATDEEFVVDTYVGVHVERDRVRLWPPSVPSTKENDHA